MVSLDQINKERIVQYQVISGDSHIDLQYLPPDLFVDNAPPEWKHQVPRVVQTRNGHDWFAEDKDLGTVLFSPHFTLKPHPRGTSKHIDRMYEVGFYDGQPHPTTPVLRLGDQDLDGVDAEVIYPIIGLGSTLNSRQLVRIIYQIYNEWVADFCKVNPQRLIALACIPNHDPLVASEELFRAARLGLKGAEFVVSTAVKPLWHRDWDVLWAAADECQMPISFHTSPYPVREPSDNEMAREYAHEVMLTRITLFQIVAAEFLASIVFSGALQRYPRMKFVLGEAGVGWIPYCLARMDQEIEDHSGTTDMLLKPSDYWGRQGFTTFQHEVGVDGMVSLVGASNIMWGSDYPHLDGVWPDSLKWIQHDLGSLESRIRRKLIRDNAGKLYQLLN